MLWTVILWVCVLVYILGLILYVVVLVANYRLRKKLERREKQLEIEFSRVMDYWKLLATRYPNEQVPEHPFVISD